MGCENTDEENEENEQKSRVMGSWYPKIFVYRVLVN